MANNKPKAEVDWAAIEIDWRAGVMSKGAMSDKYSISPAAMNKRFNKLGVPRDLSHKIQEKASAMVSVAMVSGMVSTETNPTDAVIIEVNAQLQANVLLSHRKDINRYRNLTSRLLEEIEIETCNSESFAELSELIIWKAGDDEDGAAVQTSAEYNRMAMMQKLFDKVMSNPGRVDSMKKLADTLKTLIGLERQALGLKDDNPVEPPPIDTGINLTAARVVAAKVLERLK